MVCKLLNALVTAIIVLVLAMATVDFLTTGHVDLLGTSGACCAPLLCVALNRRPARPKAQADTIAPHRVSTKKSR